MQHNYIGRKLKKRDMRSVSTFQLLASCLHVHTSSFSSTPFVLVLAHCLQLWIERINIASREHGVPYSQLMDGLVKVYITHIVLALVISPLLLV